MMGLELPRRRPRPALHVIAGGRPKGEGAADRQFWAIQTLAPPAQAERAPLYWRIKAGAARWKEGRILLRAGAKISFNTYFNSLYERVWQRRTSIGGLSFRFIAKGRMRCTLYRETKAGLRRPLVSRTFEARHATAQIIDIPPTHIDERQDSARVFVEFQALVRSTWGYFRGTEVSWQKWKRSGVFTNLS